MSSLRLARPISRRLRRTGSDGHPPASFIRNLDELLRSSRITRPARRLAPYCSTGKSDSIDGSEGRPLHRRMGRVVTFIDEHLDSPLNLDRLAAEADLSKYHFSRLFRKELGQTPWSYVRAARVERAKALLEQGASPAAAAVDAGFCDQSHLTNVMREVDGKTPKQYQRQTRSKDLQE